MRSSLLDNLCNDSDIQNRLFFFPSANFVNNVFRTGKKIVDPLVSLDADRWGYTYTTLLLSVKTINNGLTCSELFLSTTGLLPTRREVLEDETQSSAVTFF